ncbi:DUF3999 family protein [Bacillus mangrovi]|uniref:DUF3999 family protein n=1 Tax=Metabacillus mangrovi TaxID=1491830 RepID=A0A7X2S7H8_9BACI|nr:DUF3999 family protein [Metabacillus mangrovi]MTH54698.1 DUF3999 family protein [Metabacillus mangrovi]
MFRRIKGLILASVFLTAVPAAAAEEQWKYSKPIQTPETGNYVSLFLDEEVYAGANEDLSDLRIRNEKGKDIAYYVNSGYMDISEEETVYSSESTGSMEEDGSIFYDFKLLPLEENTDISGEIIQVDLPEPPFLYKVTLFGSYDGSKWEPAAEDILYDTGDAVKDTIELGEPEKYRYYRLQVKGSSKDKPFDGLTLLHSEKTESFKQFLKQKKPEYSIQQQDSETIITVRNPQKLKAASIYVKADGSFKRLADVTDKSGAWFLKGEELYSADFKETSIQKTTLQFNEPVASEEILIVIENGDSPPLNIEEVTMDYYMDQLVFDKSGSKSVSLYYGSPEAQAPQYDLEEFKSFIEKEKPVQASLGPVKNQPEPEKEAAPAQEKQENTEWYQSQWTFNIIIGLVSILLIVFILQKMNRTGQ